jgi:hypothetical protein
LYYLSYFILKGLAGDEVVVQVPQEGSLRGGKVGGKINILNEKNRFFFLAKEVLNY